MMMMMDDDDDDNDEAMHNWTLCWAEVQSNPLFVY